MTGSEKEMHLQRTLWYGYEPLVAQVLMSETKCTRVFATRGFGGSATGRDTDLAIFGPVLWWEKRENAQPILNYGGSEIDGDCDGEAVKSKKQQRMHLV